MNFSSPSHKTGDATSTMPRRTNTRRMDSEASSSMSAYSSPSLSSSSSHLHKPTKIPTGIINIGPLLSSIPIDAHIRSEVNGFREGDKSNNTDAGAHVAILNSALGLLTKSNTERRSIQRAIAINKRCPYPPPDTRENSQ